MISVAGRCSSVAESSRDARRRPRFLLYCHDGLGLGHLRRTIAIAAGIAQRRPDAALVAFTSLLQAHAFALPATLDLIKLPSIAKEDLYDTEADESPELGGSRDVHTVREAIIAATVDSFAPDVILVDHEPGGLGGELISLVRRLAAAGPSRPTLVVGMRDITYSPAQTRRAWRTDGLYDLLDRVYDRILIYGNQDVFDPVRKYGFSPAAAAKTTFTGYIRRPEPVTARAVVRDRVEARAAPLVVVTVGGGSDGAELIRTYLAAVRAGWLAGAVSYLVAGPQLPESAWRELASIAAGLSGVTLVPFCDDLVSYLHAADVVVTMGGYNALSEAVAANKRPIVVPRQGGLREQAVRAKRFDELGLARHLPPCSLTPDRLGALVRAELDGGVTPAPVLDFGGLDRIAEVLLCDRHR